MVGQVEAAFLDGDIGQRLVGLLQQLAGAYLPYQVFLMLPYILSILALILMSRRAEVPAAAVGLAGSASTGSGDAV